MHLNSNGTICSILTVTVFEFSIVTTLKITPFFWGIYQPLATFYELEGTYPLTNIG